ncbi:MAG: hypothetical protein ABW048_11055 [Sphingobium sp.]
MANFTDNASSAPAVPPTGNVMGNRAQVPTPDNDAPTKIIGLQGLGDLHIGQPVPEGGRWAERGGQTGDSCRTVTSPDYPGVYAIVTEDRVQRITVGQRSDVKLVEGIGIGSTEKDVSRWFAGFRAEPHKYVAAPAKYLTAPNAAKAESALRFEIGEDGRVSMIHIGRMPVLAYVEGCG